jgi:hypothetical protein
MYIILFHSGKLTPDPSLPEKRGEKTKRNVYSSPSF